MDFAALLVELEGRWRSLGVPVDRVLNPGADAVVVERTLREELGAAPPQLVTWFAWRDGSPWGAEWSAAPLSRPLLSLQHALERRNWLLTSVNPGITDDEPELPQWLPSWLPIGDAMSSDYTAVDGLTGEVLDVDYWSGRFALTVASTLDVAVCTWIRVLDTGLYRWRDDQWVYDYAQVPRELRISGLVH